MSLKTYTVSSSQCPFFYAILERLCFIVIIKERIDLSNEFIEADVTYIIKELQSFSVHQRRDCRNHCSNYCIAAVNRTGTCIRWHPKLVSSLRSLPDLSSLHLAEAVYRLPGPTAAFATIVAGIVAKDGMDGLVIATILAGIFLVLMGLCHFGSLIKFIPFTITTGFTSGIAVTIVIGQLKDFFGLTYPDGVKPIETTEKFRAVVENFLP